MKDLIINVIRYIRKVLCSGLFLAFSLRKYHKNTQKELRVLHKSYFSEH